MLDIIKTKTEFGYSFDLCTDDGVFCIEYFGNLDLYWMVKYPGNLLQGEEKKEFYITKENYFLFSLFDTLYQRVKNYEIFSHHKEDFEFGIEIDSINSNQKIRKMDQYNPRRLFQNNCIEWYSDDFDYDIASILKIEQLGEKYKVTFSKSKGRNFPTYSVRIRTSGSRYGYFWMVFMDMYQELCCYDEEYHQIHMEEYLYQKKMLQKKKTI